ncbi:hypothetical protein WR25_26376 [Diploscapter pachys]|uniref:C2H2-type domain-containing protein n=1 Tax=Diploscapter pachys TaxID=2018661 RepID=A0A2A2JHX4_9BILA|nr:hypothetical protein WR25_26376 [Diploscapter pachys]
MDPPQRPPNHQYDVRDNVSISTPFHGSGFNSIRPTPAPTPINFEMVNFQTPSSKIECSRCTTKKPNINAMKMHIQVEHLEWFPWKCLECNVLKPSYGKLKEHQDAKHGEECGMQKLANSEKSQELERLANLALQGLKDVRQTQPQPPSPQISPPVHNPQPSAPVNIVNSATAKVAPSSSRESKGTDDNTNETPRFRRLTVKVEPLDDCQIVEVRPWDTNAASMGMSAKRRRTGAPASEQAQLEAQVPQPPSNRESTDRADENESELPLSPGNSAKVPMPTSEPSPVSEDTEQLISSDHSRESHIDSNPEDTSKTSPRKKKSNRNKTNWTHRKTKSDSRSLKREGHNKSSRRIDKRYKCNLCSQYVAKRRRKEHAFIHLHKDKNITCFSCSYPTCGFTHYRRSSVQVHITLYHKNDKRQYKAMGSISTDVARRAQEMMDACFDDVQGILGDTHLKQASERPKIQAKSPEIPTKSEKRDRKIRAPRKETGQIGKSIYCHLCKCYKSANEYGMGVLQHVATHMKREHLLNRYKCLFDGCGYQAPHKSNILMHISGRHKNACTFEDIINDWPIENVIDVAVKCFKDKTVVLSCMPYFWREKYKNFNSDEMSSARTRAYSPQEAPKSQQLVEENLPEAPESENNADVDSPLILESCP